MKHYIRLSPKERESISNLLSQGLTITEISNSIGRDKSTISRELRRNRGYPGGYSAIDAQFISQLRSSERRSGYRKLNHNPVLVKYIKKKLSLRWSPQQISMSLKNEYPEDKSMQVSHETIYTYIYVLGKGSLKKELIRHLRHSKNERGPKIKAGRGKGRIPEMISIEERPVEVESRTIPGHWEGDLIIGAKQASALGTIVERTTRTVILVPLKGRDATTVRKSFAKELKKLPQQMRLSMTYDQGIEMNQHRLFTRETNIKVYFAHPHSPWERGTNENTNMLIRDYFPKGTDFRTISRRRIKEVQKQLNERPRKALNWSTPKEVFNQLLQKVS